jgi:hypothetical protein
MGAPHTCDADDLTCVELAHSSFPKPGIILLLHRHVPRGCRCFGSEEISPDGWCPYSCIVTYSGVGRVAMADGAVALSVCRRCRRYFWYSSRLPRGDGVLKHRTGCPDGWVFLEFPVVLPGEPALPAGQVKTGSLGAIGPVRAVRVRHGGAFRGGGVSAG